MSNNIEMEVKKEHTISIVWSTDDIDTVLEGRKIELPFEEKVEILNNIKNKHDANIGISWDTLEYHIDQFVKNKHKKRANGLEVRILPDTLEPKKVVITAYYSYNNEPLRDSMDILNELDNCCIWHHSNNSNYAYLEDEAGFRYCCSDAQYDDKLDKDLEALISGEIDKIEYERDEEFLRPADIEYLSENGYSLFTVETWNTKYYNCRFMKNSTDADNSILSFMSEEDEHITIDYDETENVKHQEKWV